MAVNEPRQKRYRRRSSPFVIIEQFEQHSRERDQFQFIVIDRSIRHVVVVIDFGISNVVVEFEFDRGEPDIIEQFQPEQQQRKQQQLSFMHAILSHTQLGQIESAFRIHRDTALPEGERERLRTATSKLADALLVEDYWSIANFESEVSILIGGVCCKLARCALDDGDGALAETLAALAENLTREIQRDFIGILLE